MKSETFEAILMGLEERADKIVKPKLTEVKEKYEELQNMAGSTTIITMEMRQRAGRLYSELSGFAGALSVLSNISYFNYTQIMADLGAILAAVM